MKQYYKNNPKQFAEDKTIKYWVCFKGKEPGIYNSKEELDAHNGCSVEFGKYETEEGALAAVERYKFIKRKKYYVVFRGKTPGIYDKWSNARRQIENFDKPKWKLFNRLIEAQDAFRDYKIYQSI